MAKHNLAILVVALVGLAPLAACTEGGAMLSPDGWEVARTALTENAEITIQVTPPAGAPAALANAIATAVAARLEDMGIHTAVGPGPVQGGYILSATAEANTDPEVSYPVILSWLVTNAYGQLVHSYALGVEGTREEWDAAAPAMVRAIGESTARPIGQWALAEQGLVQSALPGAPRSGFGVLLSRIQGLNGSDGRALGDALKTALLKRDYLITEDPRQATFGLTGRVEMTASAAPGAAAETVRITWRVFRGDRQIGGAVQESEVRAGALEGSWDEVAPAVAAGAAEAITQILSGGGNSAFSPGHDSQPPQTPLPQVPGRGPPPPP